jgi:DNA invertase Pin-like site-specific DNA recombinase
MGLAGAVSVCTNLQYRARSDAVGAIIVARGTMRVAIYARVSTGEQNPELQLRELRDYAERRGFIVHREYVEKVTGDLRRRKRAPEFEAMMADARRGRFDCVLVWKYDRFARSLGALVAALQEFRDLGIDFISHTQAIDTTTPMGRLFFHVIGSFAEFERDVIVERVRAGLANARAKGKRLGRPVRDPAAEQRVLALERDEGLSLRQIAAREGLSPSGVRKMLLRAEAAASPAA